MCSLRARKRSAYDKDWYHIAEMSRGARFQLVLFAGMAWSADDKDRSDIDKRLEASAHVLTEIMSTPDKAIPDKVMSDAKCIAVIPSMVKIAIGFGGSHGKGVATCRTQDGRWSAPAPITITGGSWGLQLGGQAVDIVMIITNDQGMQHLLSSKFKIGADAGRRRSGWTRCCCGYRLENEGGGADLFSSARNLRRNRPEWFSGYTGQR